jgi:hypothetical protein
MQRAQSQQDAVDEGNQSVPESTGTYPEIDELSGPQGISISFNE